MLTRFLAALQDSMTVLLGSALAGIVILSPMVVLAVRDKMRCHRAGTSLCVAMALAITLAGTAFASSYSFALMPGDGAIFTCGSALAVTFTGPGKATVACVKSLAADVDGATYPGAPEHDADGIGGAIYETDLNTGDVATVTCPLPLSMDWWAQSVMLGCGL